MTTEDVLAALTDIDNGNLGGFGPSTFYDLLYRGERYPPKAVFGLAAGKVRGAALRHDDFSGGEGTVCFLSLRDKGFLVISKANYKPFPDEVDTDTEHYEGALIQVSVNRYERDPAAREACIEHHGTTCKVCSFDFGRAYGSLGDGFIHVHHIRPLAAIGHEYQVNPIFDMIPVCPNCHAMLHRSTPPLTVESLKQLSARRMSLVDAEAPLLGPKDNSAS